MKRLATKKLLNKITTEISVVVFFLILLTVISLSLIAQKYQEEQSKEYSIQIDKTLDYVIDHFVKDYSERALVLSKMTQMQELVQKQDTEALLELLNQRFQGMRAANPSFEVMHIHLANGVSLLRVHKPKQYGDNIAKKRAMLQEIHKTHKPISGYESGLLGNDYRVISPIFNRDGIYIGAIELGLNLEFILHSISAISGFNGLIFIKENQLGFNIKPSDLVINGYSLQSTVDETLREKLDAFKVLNKLGENLEFEVNEQKYRSHMININNFKNEPSVKIIFFQDLKSTSSFFTPFQYFIYSLIFVILLATLGLIWYRIKRYQETLRQIDKDKIERLKENEILISKSEHYLQSIFDAIPTILVVSDGESLLRVNKAMLEFFDCASLEDFTKEHKCICERFIEKDGFLGSTKGDKTWLDYVKENPDETHKVCIKKGSLTHYFLIETQYFTYNENTLDLISYTDITELEGLNERLEIAVNSTNDGLWDWDLIDNTIYFSPRLKEMLGYKEDEFENKFESWQNRVHHDDLMNVLREIDEAQSKPGVKYENIHRLQHKDGSWVWVLDRGKIIFDKNAKATRMVGFHTDITKQKELESKLLNSQKQFEYFMEFIPAIIAIKSEDRKIIYANNLMKKHARGSVIGKRAEDLFPSEIANKLRSLDEEALKNGDSEILLDFTDSSGNKRIFRNLCFKIQEKDSVKIGIVSVDITEKYKAQYEVTKLKSALDSSPLSIIMTDSAGNIQYVNPYYTKVSGYSLEELIGKNPRIVKSGDISALQYQKMWEHISRGEVWNADVRNIAKDGTTFWEDSTIIPTFDTLGEVDGYIAFKLDITDKIDIRKKLKEQEELMIAQSRHAAMGEMISMIAHQWRQPISVIAMDANNILVDVELELIDNESLKENVEDILDQTAHLSQTIDDFRDFFKPNKVKDIVNIADVFNEALKVIYKSLENSNIELQNNFQTSSELTIFSRELLQVILNILKNAKESLVEYRQENRKITNTINEDDENVIISICDNGGGLADDIVDKIFEPYFTTKNEKNGTGLGLYMSKTIIEKHLLGSINIQKDADNVCFVITIPKEEKTRG